MAEFFEAVGISVVVGGAIIFATWALFISRITSEDLTQLEEQKQKDKQQ